ncbi:Iron hydrogenase large subunit C-terminal, partial [Trinorchestia longiramus]
ECRLAGSESDGGKGEVLRVCRAYGFRNLQNIVQKVRRGKSAYHFVEVMVCSRGCLKFERGSSVAARTPTLRLFHPDIGFWTPPGLLGLIFEISLNLGFLKSD